MLVAFKFIWDRVHIGVLLQNSNTFPRFKHHSPRPKLLLGHDTIQFPNSSFSLKMCIFLLSAIIWPPVLNLPSADYLLIHNHVLYRASHRNVVDDTLLDNVSLFICKLLWFSQLMFSIHFSLCINMRPLLVYSDSPFRLLWNWWSKVEKKNQLYWILAVDATLWVDSFGEGLPQTDDRSAETKGSKLQWFECWIRLKSRCISPVNTVPHHGPRQSNPKFVTMWGKRQP